MHQGEAASVGGQRIGEARGDDKGQTVMQHGRRSSSTEAVSRNRPSRAAGSGKALWMMPLAAGGAPVPIAAAQTRVMEGKTEEVSVKRRAPSRNAERTGMRAGVTRSVRNPSNSTINTRLADTRGVAASWNREKGDEELIDRRVR